MTRSLAGLAGLAVWALSWTALPSPASTATDTVGDSPERTVSALWRAMSHDPGRPADIGSLRRILHPQAVVFGSREADGRPSLSRTEAEDFLRLFERIETEGFHECEIARTVEVHGRFASVTSVVESRTDPESASPDFTGINSLQLYRDDAGWRILSLYYHVGTEGTPIRHGGVSGVCLS